jgi:integrase
MRFTTKSIIALKPALKAYWKSDDSLPGFRVKVEPSGVKSFAIRIRSRGGRKNRTDTMNAIGRFGVVTVEEARERARELLSRSTLGADLAAEQREARTAQSVAELSQRFLLEREGKIKPRTLAEYRRLFEVEIIPALGKTAARDVTRQQVAKMHHERRKRPYLANRCVTLLASLYSWGDKHGYSPEGFRPTRGIELFPEKGRERSLTDKELRQLGVALITAERIGLPPDSKRAAYNVKRHGKRKNGAPRLTKANPYAVAAIRFLMLSGWREQEALTLRWEMLDLDKCRADLPDTKTDRSYRDLGGAAVAVLRALPVLQGSSFVFPGSKPNTSLSDIKHVWGAVRQAAELPTLRLHDLRHVFASVGADMGIPLQTLGAVLGHSEIGTTKKYAHLSESPRARAAGEIADKIAAQMNGGETKVRAIRAR